MPGEIKINIDATWCSSTRLGGVGIVARDHAGNIYGGRHNQLVGGSVEEMEAAAIVDGILLAVEMGWSHIRVDSDSETVITHLKGATFTWTIDAILSHARPLTTSLSTVRWVEIPRIANKCGLCG